VQQQQNNEHFNSAELERFGRALLDCPSSGLSKQLVDPVLHKLCDLIDLELHPEFFTDPDATATAYGKAVSPTTAAQCAEDAERGRVFTQGLYQAICDQLQLKPTQPVRLLYAGTGPLGWLLLPLLPLFTAQQLQVTALDIHQWSLQSLRRLTDRFAVSDRICDWVCADATAWQPQVEQYFDLILSETMKHLLQQEPQVQVFRHLQQFLAPQGQLIPQQIKLDAYLEWTEQQQKKQQWLGPLFTLDLALCHTLASGDESAFYGELLLPEFEAGPVDLKLTTEVQVYRQHWLKEQQSQLTLPRYKQRLMLQPASVVRFEYQQLGEPDFDFQYTELWPDLCDSEDTSCAGLFHAKRLWQKTVLKRYKKLQADVTDEWVLDKALLDLSGIGLEPGIQALHRCSRLSDFAAFLVPYLQQLDLDALNQQLRDLQQQSATPLPKVLTAEQLEFWQREGYLVIPGVLSQEQCQQSREVIWQYLQADPNQPDSWYQKTDKMQKIMLQLFRHPVLDANREVPLIRQIFQQLWQRTDLVMTTDRVSFNPPETAFWSFPGPDMHWDVELITPIPYATQGLIYLTDTEAQQGAFSCVPGFHLKIDDWIKDSGKSAMELQQQNWADWPVKAIAAKAGDLIIWHQALPHGASRNLHHLPRMVHYINMYPAKV
jgi:hypothetical protein